MKLNQIEIDNFAGVSQANINLSAPVNVILGLNRAAKTSIRDAIEFVVTGGFCVSRGYYKKNQAPEITNRYTNGKLSVKLHTDEGVFERHVTTNGSSGNAPAIAPEIARIAVNPQSVLDMKPEDRQRVFLFASSNNADTEKKIETYLKKAGFDKDIIDRCLEDLDDAQKWAIEQRRIAKRSIEDTIKAVPANIPQPIIKIDEKQIDLTAINIEQYKSILKQRGLERDKCIAEHGAATNELQQIIDEDVMPSESFQDALRAVEQQLKDIDLSATESAFKAAQNSYDHCYIVERKRDNILAECKGQLKAITDDIDRISELENNQPCITCLQKVTTKTKEAAMAALSEKKEKAFDQMTLAQKDHDEAVRKIDAFRTKREQLLSQLETLNEKKTSLESQLKELNAINAKVGRRVQLTKNIPLLENQLADLDKRLDALIKVVEAWCEYNTYQDIQINADKNIKANKETIVLMNSLDELLKPDGAVRKIANEVLEQSGFDVELQQAWEMESLKLGTDGTITLDGAPIESACYTEKYMAGVLLAELLSRQLGLGFLILDDIDHLKKPLRDALHGVLRFWSMTFNSILLFSAVDKKPELNSNDFMCFHWAENGTCEPIGELAEAV